MKETRDENRFVADGQRRARSACEDEVRAEGEARYAEALATAGFWGRLWLRRRMGKEIERRLKELAPDDALYLTRRLCRCSHDSPF